METAVYAISDFVDSLNSTAIAVSLLDFYTDATVNGSLLLAPDCLYNVSFGGDDATEFLDRPWLALPTVSVVAVDDDDDDDDDDNDENISFNATDNSTSPLTPWETGGARRSFGRQGGGRDVVGGADDDNDDDDGANVRAISLLTPPTARKSTAQATQNHISFLRAADHCFVGGVASSARSVR